MNWLEISLTVLVVIWSAIFLLLAAGLLMIFWKVKKGIDKINQILQDTKSITGNLANPLSKAFMGAGFIKDAIDSVIKFTRKSPPKKVRIVKGK